MSKTGIKSTLFALTILLVTAPLWAQLSEPVLQVGDWVKAEPWHNWIGGEGRTSHVRLHVIDTAELIQRVDFYYSIDYGKTWTMFGTDNEGQEPLYSTITTLYTPSGPVTIDPALLADGDGWSAIFHHNMVPQLNMLILFRAQAIVQGGDTLIVETKRNYDPTPPDDAVVSWVRLNPDTVLVTVSDPYFDIDSLCVFVEPKQDSFMKGIPGINQRKHSDYHCVPAAAAACLKYFEGTGDGDVTGGLDDSLLVDTLADLSGTDPSQGGTLWRDIVAALDDWLRQHGDNYTMRSVPFNWETARNELERCQDVLMSIQWPNSDAWHMMTFNSIVNTPNFDGTIRVDFMDPWTGEIEWGDLDPRTGWLSGFSGVDPEGTLTDMLIICPKESNVFVSEDSSIGGVPGPEPLPMPAPLSDTCTWFLHVVVVDMQNNACRFTRIVPTVSVHPAPNQQGLVIPNFYLAQNSPNPFTGKTTVSFALPRTSSVTLSVYDVLGRCVVTLARGEMAAGVYHISWNGRDARGRKLEPGTYFCELATASGFKQTLKMVKMK